MIKNRRIIASVLFIAIASVGGYQWYQEKQERKAQDQELLRKYRNTPDEEYTGGNDEKPENQGNAMGGGGDNFVHNMDKQQQSEQRCECLNCSNKFDAGDGIADYCGHGYYTTSANGAKHKVVTSLKSGCRDFCSRRCYDEYHSHSHNGHDYGSTTAELPGN